jgi:hypothetical protein
MNRTITPEETRQLFEFCEKKRVKHYDVQFELVDHLASDIEEQWKISPEMKFNEALTLIYSKFGIFGFAHLTEQKRNQLAKKYKNLLWEYFRGFYSMPKVVLTFAISFCIYQISREINNVLLVFLPFSFILIVIGAYMEVSYFLKIRKLKTEKKFLLAEIYSNTKRGARSLLMIPFLPVYIRNIFDFEGVIKQNWLLFVISFLLVALSILIIGELFFIPKRIKEHFFEQFPEFAETL